MNIDVKLKELQVSDKGARVLLQNVRLAFVKLDKAETRFSNKDSEGNPIDGIYSVTCLLPKNNSGFTQVKTQLLKTVKQLVEMSKFIKNKTDKSKILKTALAYNKKGAMIKNGDMQLNNDGNVYDGLAGMDTIMAKTKAMKTPDGFRPKIDIKMLYRDKTRIPKNKIADELYSGVYADVAINLRPYTGALGSGVSCYLTGVMKLIDADRIGGSDPFEVRDDIDDAVDFTADEY